MWGILFSIFASCEPLKVGLNKIQIIKSIDKQLKQNIKK